MADGVNFDGLTQELDVCECPECKETIDANARVCRFCGAKIDHEAAKKAAHLLANVDQACSEASYLRNASVIALVLLVGALIVVMRSGRLIEAVGFQNILLGFCVLVLFVSSPFPIWSMRWWTKYASITSDDEELQSARGAVRKAGFVATGALLAFGAILCVVLVSRVTAR
jgi:hypothetical protein